MTKPENNIRTCIEKRTRQLLRQAAPLCRSHRQTVPDPSIRFDLRGRAAGQAQWHPHERPLLRFNLDIARRQRNDFLERTVAHEVAHLVTAACHGRTRPHGPEWLAVMKFLGVSNPSRCHDYDIEESKIKRQRRWTYVCDCSNHELSTTRHNRVQAGTASYQCRRCLTNLRPGLSHGT